ncbi:uncharacterized protein LOC110839567 isoform X2 [Zootermopsis nevadensis]|uniref:uncharacterized protein LOC110839567 isoform X2 n=1 Tax=Zootermopsis nevadensis TaxID=136037 RepID=UPI000B8EBA61|nr:uncharacterized protein LOC110839567 isoform X2 [Zootermopsis nevadensis]
MTNKIRIPSRRFFPIVVRLYGNSTHMNMTRLVASQLFVIFPLRCNCCNVGRRALRSVTASVLFCCGGVDVELKCNTPHSTRYEGLRVAVYPQQATTADERKIKYKKNNKGRANASSRSIDLDAGDNVHQHVQYNVIQRTSKDFPLF